MATAAFTTVVDRAIGDPLTEAIWDDQLKDNLNQLAGAHQNLLTNGGFEVWQRGAGGFSGDGAYTADRWNIFGFGGLIPGTHTVTKETSTVDSASTAALKVVSTNTPGASIQQKIEDYTQLKGRTVSFSARVRQGLASSVTLVLDDGVGTSTSATSATTGSYVTLTVTRTLSASATRLLCQVVMPANQTNYLDNAMLVIGPAPAPYQPLHPQEDLARCQRYYEVLGGYSGALSHYAYGLNAATHGQWVPFATRKGGTPTMTKNGTWAATNCGQPTATLPGPDGFFLSAVASATAALAFGCNSTDDTVTAEWNP